MSMKYLLLITVLSLFFIFGCQTKDINTAHNSKNELQVSPATTIAPPFNDSNKATNIPLNFVEGISEEEAVNLCLAILGEKAEETGFKLAYRCVGAVEFESQNYYVMYRSWLVDDNHWSYIGYAMVSASGDKIYDGIIDQDGTYHLTRKLWEK